MKKVLIALAAFVLFAVPAVAGDFELFGSWWDTKDAGDAIGGGLGYNWHLGEVLGLGIRASYYEEMSSDELDDALDDALGSDNLFEDGIKVLPIEVNLRFSIAPDSSVWNPYVSGGLSYFSLDTDTGNIDDETGFNLLFGSTFGDKEGADFLVELGHRWVEGQVGDLGDIDDSFEGDNSELDVDLNGWFVNAGVAWKW